MDWAQVQTWISRLTSSLSEPIGLVFMAFSLAGSLALLLTLRYDYRFEVMRLSGVPRTVASLFISGLAALAVLSLFLTGITTSRPWLPWWTSAAVLLPSATILVVVIFLHLWRRDTFTLKRFVNTIALPALLPALPILDAARALLDPLMR